MSTGRPSTASKPGARKRRAPTAASRPPASAYPFDGVPETGSAREIRPGLLWIRMPLPFVLNHINVYALEDGDGWTIIATGARHQRPRQEGCGVGELEASKSQCPIG